MSGIDWLILVVVAISVITAIAQGFFYEVFTLAGVVIGYLLAAWEYWRVAPWFAPYVKWPWAADLAGFLTIFVAVTILAGIVGRVARWGVQGVGLRWFDRALGGAFGLVRGLGLATVMVLAFASFAPRSEMLARSQFASYLIVIGRAAVWVAPAQVRQQFRKGVMVLRDARLAAESPPKASQSPQ
jgi:membrane protein required for colicin V production